MSLLEALAVRADRVTASRALGALAPAMAAHVKDEDRRKMIRDLERRAGRAAAAAHTKPADVARTVQALGLGFDGR